MNEKASKIKITLLLWLFILLIIVLGAMSSCLYVSNAAYRQQNRDLIIQNDSVISVNIGLTRELEYYKRTSLAGAGNNER